MSRIREMVPPPTFDKGIKLADDLVSQLKRWNSDTTFSNKYEYSMPIEGTVYKPEFKILLPKILTLQPDFTVDEGFRVVTYHNGLQMGFWVPMCKVSAAFGFDINDLAASQRDQIDPYLVEIFELTHSHLIVDMEDRALNKSRVLPFRKKSPPELLPGMEIDLTFSHTWPEVQQMAEKVFSVLMNLR